VSPAGWTVFAVFSATIVGFLLRPLPMAPLVLIALVVPAVLGPERLRPRPDGTVAHLAFPDLLTGYASGTVWLVVAAFFIAGALGTTGLGRRIALLLVRALGRSTLGLGYAFCGAELVLAPVVPSVTARGGGVMAPIVRSVAQALGSNPGPTARRAGSYLVLTAANANLVTAAMFLTAMAANGLVAEAAKTVLGVELTWGRWALGALVPGLLSLGLLPLVLLRLCPPELRDTRRAQAQVRRELRGLGAWSWREKVMAAVFVLLILLWGTELLHGVKAVVVAWLGVCVLLVGRVLSWEDARTNAGAWEALVWLGGLVSLATLLEREGVVAWFADNVRGQVEGLGGVTAAIVLAAVYFYSMYGFSMFTGHITAFVAAFFAVALAVGAPPMLVALLFAYFGTLCGCTTHYSTAPVVIYFGFGYVTVPRWFGVGFLLSLVHLGVWLTVGLAWWHVLGWW